MQVARVKLVEAQAIAQENKRLKAALALSESEVEPVALGRLIGSTSSSTRRFAYISSGSADGVKPEMPVVSPMGLVGRVLETGRHSARVLLLTDSESMVPVRRATDDVVAFAEGRPDGSLRLRLINLGINPLKKGDVFVTSGAGGLFRPNIPVAVVEELEQGRRHRAPAEQSRGHRFRQHRTGLEAGGGRAVAHSAREDAWRRANDQPDQPARSARRLWQQDQS